MSLSNTNVMTYKILSIYRNKQLQKKHNDSNDHIISNDNSHDDKNNNNNNNDNQNDIQNGNQNGDQNGNQNDYKNDNNNMTESIDTLIRSTERMFRCIRIISRDLILHSYLQFAIELFAVTIASTLLSKVALASLGLS